MAKPFSVRRKQKSLWYEKALNLPTDIPGGIWLHHMMKRAQAGVWRIIWQLCPGPDTWSKCMSEKATGVTANKSKREFTLTWDDGHVSIYPFGLLRAACPC